MKTLLVCFFIMVSAVTIFPQSQTIETGLYLVVPRDSCSSRKGMHSVAYLSGTLCLEQHPVLAGNDIESCIADSTTLDGRKAFTLNIKLNKPSALRLKEVTTRNVGNRLAMIMDQQVVIAVVIRDPITSGRLTISGETRPVIQEWGMKLKKEIRE